MGALGDTHSSDSPPVALATVKSETLQVGTLNTHLLKESKRDYVIRMIQDWTQLDLCAIVEVWLKESNRIINAELKK